MINLSLSCRSLSPWYCLASDISNRIAVSAESSGDGGSSNSHDIIILISSSFIPGKWMIHSGILTGTSSPIRNDK